ncbi:hypothetical protein [Rubellimicrobium aerolatum]|uniref:Uncharacterized protein n=1 Tax=Rubellimicrobium aerolatum TaxID=490979 RepID=A0ABW0SA63_9RHOB|nr:hypothetical protein [Rubellimicrobium aerolatum]MBP1805200.1 hypothetical protein [Rubellimicrobium aerolatum]
MDQNQTAGGDQGDQRSQSLQRRYQVREVTQYQASWVEQGRGEDGKFTLQLILDNGVEEYILEPTEDDIDVILKLLGQSKHTMFDMERKVLMFSNLKA